MKPESTTRIYELMGWLPLAVLPFSAAAASWHLQPWVFMWVLSSSIYFGLKWWSWWKARNKIVHAPWRSIAYVLAWPGMDAKPFLDASRSVPLPPWRAWVAAVLKTCFGAGLLWGVARCFPAVQPLWRGWTGMIGLIFLLHFGSFHIVALFWQSLGVDAKPIMASPLRSESLGEFWGKRWNLGFRQLAHELIFVPLHKKLGAKATGFLVFVASGVIHDLVISVPACGGYGLPTGYFAVQGLGVLVEHSSFGARLGLRKGVRGWLFTVLFTAAPAFWLFHPWFVVRVIIPFMYWIHAL